MNKSRAIDYINEYQERMADQDKFIQEQAHHIRQLEARVLVARQQRDLHLKDDVQLHEDFANAERKIKGATQEFLARYARKLLSLRKSTMKIAGMIDEEIPNLGDNGRLQARLRKLSNQITNLSGETKRLIDVWDDEPMRWPNWFQKMSEEIIDRARIKDKRTPVED